MVVDQMMQLPLSTIMLVAAAVLLASYLIATSLPRLLNPKLPPVMQGLPLVGGIMQFLKGPMKMMQDGYAKHGEVFTVPLLTRNFTFLLDPCVSGHFFKASDDEMSQYEVYNFNIPTFGPGVVYDVDIKVRNEQFRWLGEALKGKKLLSYIPGFVKEAQDFVRGWTTSGVIDLKDQLGILTTLTASRTLLGREVRENMFDEVAKLLHALDEGMIPISVFSPYLPIPAHFRRDKARKQLGDIFAKVIRERKARGAQEDDLLQVFIDAKYQRVNGGRGTTEQECTGLMIAGLFAGQHTSSVVSSWTGYYMIGHKEWYDKAVEEQRAIIREFGDELSYEALSKMEVLHAIITEALRMHPPLVMLLRYARQAMSVTTRDGKQYVIPKGHTVVTSPSFAHRLEHVYKNPDEFDPSRYGPGREEDKKAQFSYIGFGGGRHSCMGYNFAYLQVWWRVAHNPRGNRRDAQIKTIWSVLLRNFEWELVDPIPEPNWNAMVIGPLNGRVKYVPRERPL